MLFIINVIVYLKKQIAPNSLWRLHPDTVKLLPFPQKLLPLTQIHVH